MTTFVDEHVGVMCNWQSLSNALATFDNCTKLSATKALGSQLIDVKGTHHIIVEFQPTKWSTRFKRLSLLDERVIVA